MSQGISARDGTPLTAPTLQPLAWNGSVRKLARAVWLGAAVLAALTLAASVPGYVGLIGAFTDQDRYAANLMGMAAIYSPSPAFEFWNDAVYAGLSLGTAVLSLALAAWIYRRKADEPMAWAVSLTLLAYGIIMAGPMEMLLGQRQAAIAAGYAAQMLLWGWFVGLLLVFPDGRFTPRWTRWLAVLLVLWTLALAALQFTPLVIEYPDVFFVVYSVPSLVAPYAQFRRYRQTSDLVQRQQAKWVIFGITAWLLAGSVVTGGLGVLAQQFVVPANPAPTFWSSVFVFAERLIWPISLTLVPLAFAISILRYRLWNIDVIIRRTLVYGLLSAGVIGLYVLVVGGLGALVQSFSPLAPLLATVLIAVGFHPVRQRLQRGVNRLLYGERDDPYAVLSGLGQRMEATLAPGAMLPTLVETIADALKLPYVAVALRPAGESELEVAAAYGLAVPVPLRLPLTYQTEQVGELRVAPRGPGETFTAAELRLLHDIAHQAGVAAHAIRLTADLQHSRERLVTAREEERRRLRRDLHDGLGPALAVHSLKVGAARSMLTGEAADGQVTSADAVLAELERDIAGTLADLRRLVYELRPPTLDELGLAAALRESAARYAPTAGGLHITVEAPEHLPPLPAAVEVAAFRITQEALTNVVRHARARNCRVRLRLEGGLALEIVDDGIGLTGSANGQGSGVGLASMRERAAELGGECLIENGPGGGTRVSARLPLS